MYHEVVEGRRVRKKIVTRDGRVVLQVLIPYDLYMKLVEVAPRIYGVHKGALSMAVEDALRAWLEPRLHATHANPPRAIWAKFRRVKQALAEILGLSSPHRIQECTEKQLELAISMTIGSDPRTIRKYKRLFQDLGLIKDMTPQLPQGRKIYEVLG